MMPTKVVNHVFSTVRTQRTTVGLCWTEGSLLLLVVPLHKCINAYAQAQIRNKLLDMCPSAVFKLLNPGYNENNKGNSANSTAVVIKWCSIQSLSLSLTLQIHFSYLTYGEKIYWTNKSVGILRLQVVAIYSPFVAQIWWTGSEVAQMESRVREGGPNASGSSSGREEENGLIRTTAANASVSHTSKLHRFPESHKATTVSRELSGSFDLMRVWLRIWRDGVGVCWRGVTTLADAVKLALCSSLSGVFERFTNFKTFPGSLFFNQLQSYQTQYCVYRKSWCQHGDASKLRWD